MTDQKTFEIARRNTIAELRSARLAALMPDAGEAEGHQGHFGSNVDLYLTDRVERIDGDVESFLPGGIVFRTYKDDPKIGSECITETRIFYPYHRIKHISERIFSEVI